MARGEYLGEFEHIVLLGLLRLDDQAYGAAIRQEIAKRAGRDVSIGALYATLDRLEAKGYIRSELGEPTAERGGRAKRFFRITASGMAVVNATQKVLRRMTDGLTLSRKPT
jgi:PadR family transcriptional regulator PadR